MAIGTASNVVIRPRFFRAGFIEGVGQNIEVFNENSNSTIRLVQRSLAGDYEKTAFWDRLTSLVSHRDDTSTSSVSSTAMTQSDDIAVKTKRLIGPVENTFDSLTSAASDEEEFSFLFGELAGEESAQDYVNTALLVLVTALINESANYKDDSGASGNTLNHTRLNDLLSLAGDARGSVQSLVMHSKAFNDLVGANISSSGDQTEFATIYQGNPGTFQRPVVVTDSTELVNTDGVSSGTDSYYTLGLTMNAIEVAEADELAVYDEQITGQENASLRVQGENAITVGLKGFTWDETNGGRNPDDATIGTATNWDTLHTNEKDRAGFVLEHA